MNKEQSNPAILREALRWYAGEIDSFPCEDVEQADDGNAWNSNKDVPSIPNIIFDQGKRAKAALAASGTEAAPVCTLCHHSLVDNDHGFDHNDASMDGDKLIHSGCCTYCKLCQAQSAQAAASPEGEGREADNVHALFEKWWDFAEATLAVDLKGMARDAFCAGWACGEAPSRQSAAPSGGVKLVSKLRDLPVHKIGASSSSWDDVEPTEYVRLSDLNALLAQESKTGVVTQRLVRKECPFCPVETRNLHAVAFNLLVATSDRDFQKHLRELKEAVDMTQPLIDRHFEEVSHFVAQTGAVTETK